MKGPQSKTHRERAQPAHRSRLGLLEKHTDYVQRAADFHRKSRQLHALQVKAQYKNANEFRFGMVKSRVGQDGTQQALGGGLAVDVARALKAEDLLYVRLMSRVNQNKLDRLAASQAPFQGKRLVFVDSDSGQRAVDRIEDCPSGGRPECAEAVVRRQRLQALSRAEQELGLQRALMGRGKRTKVGVDDQGRPVYKWAAIRQK